MKKENTLALGIFILSCVAFMIWGYFYVPKSFFFLFIVAGVFGIFMAFNIGGNDVANSFGTSVGAKTITLKQALIIAAIFELSGAILAGGAVTKTIKSSIIEMPAGADPMLFVAIMLAALLSAGLWLFFASKKGLPVSTTHSIIGGIVGASIAMGISLYGGSESLNMVSWKVIGKIALSWVVSPLLGGFLAYLAYAYIYRNIIKPSKEISVQVKALKKEKKAFKKQYFEQLKDKDIDLQLKELELIARDDEEHSVSYLQKLRDFKDREKKLDLFKYIRRRVPIVAGLALAVIAAMFLFKGLKKVSSLDLIYKLWIIGIIGVLAFFLSYALIGLMKKNQVNKTTQRIFSWLQIFTASAFAFSHGANDIANAIGPFAGIIDVFKTGSISTKAPLPLPALAMFGVALVIGLWFLGKEVMQTVGQKLAKLKPTTGFSAELGASIVILLATFLGIPVSSTHVLIGAVLGIGLYAKNANWAMLKPIALAWVITLPVSAVASFLLFYAFKAYLGL